MKKIPYMNTTTHGCDQSDHEGPCKISTVPVLSLKSWY